MKLVVTHAFGPYAIGDSITDTDEIALVLGEHPNCVVKAASDAPAQTVDSEH
jgi:hypothetical protein